MSQLILDFTKLLFRHIKINSVKAKSNLYIIIVTYNKKKVTLINKLS